MVSFFEPLIDGLFLSLGTLEVILVRGRYRPPAGGTKSSIGEVEIRIINDHDDIQFCYNI